MSARTVIVTGTAHTRGIGHAILKLFVKAGYRGVGIDIKKSEGLERSDRALDNCLFIEADLTDEGRLEEACKEACDWLGQPLDVLVNNAGISAPLLPKSGPDRRKQWHKFIATNLSAAFLMTEAVMPYFSTSGAIIHISSVRAKHSEPMSEGYASAKAGLLGLTHSQAVSLAGRCRVNAILPGYIYTEDEAPDKALSKEDHEWHLTGNVGEPEDIAELTLFLADNQKAKFITGQHFTVDGGVTAKLVYPE